MKQKSHALGSPVRRLDYLASEVRYLSRLSRQIAVPDAWDERIAMYEDYRNAHDNLMRVASLHGVGPEFLPPLMAAPAPDAVSPG